MITYKSDEKLSTEQIIDIFSSSGINRPVEDQERIYRMFENASLLVTAWDGNKPIGLARSLTDFCYCCYLSDLAVKKEYQRQGIGKELIRLTKQAVGDATMLLLLSAPAAMGYYPKIGMEKADNAFIIKRRP
jgi:ribosomal protein S18 acetylase RimI-like enzyme